MPQPCPYQGVALHVLAAGELLPADLAGVGPLPGVGPDMFLEHAGLGAGPAAVLADVLARLLGLLLLLVHLLSLLQGHLGGPGDEDLLHSRHVLGGDDGLGVGREELAVVGVQPWGGEGARGAWPDWIN